MNKKELWEKLRNYHFDHLVPTHLWDHIAANFGGSNAFSKAFASKIGKKHDWDIGFTLRAVREYKKFVYLGVTANFHVTPSKIIDVIWHEHILFSKAYREFCNEVIAYDFDHFPELIPLDEQTSQFVAQYNDTLELYRLEFDMEPPADIWETTKYDREFVPIAGLQSKRKKKRYDNGSSGSDSGTYYSDTASLHSYYDGSDGINMDGGEFGGAGAGADWSNADGETTNAFSDSDASDAGSDGGDGGSGCSSGCGGGD
jgi:hypothetical protein